MRIIGGCLCERGISGIPNRLLESDFHLPQAIGQGLMKHPAEINNLDDQNL